MAHGFEVGRPWVAWPLLVIAAFIARVNWPAYPWVLAFLSAATLLLTWLAYVHVHTRHALGYVYTIATGLAYGGIVTLTDAAGLTAVTAFALLMVIPVICLCWSLRGHTRHAEKGRNGYGSLLETAGMGGAHMMVHAEEASTAPRRPGFRDLPYVFKRQPDKAPAVPARAAGPVKGTIMAPQGETAESVIRKAPNLEAVAGLPPGALTVTPDADHRGRANFTVSDPRVIRKPVPWRGPSQPGKSIALRIRVGLYQDGTETTFLLPGVQLAVTGMVGSGKGFGGGWSILGEAVTRYDVAVWAIDVTKGRQTLGALAVALHRFETDPAGAAALLADVAGMIKPRTDYLADRGLSKWQEGCGLRYLLVWIEEAPEVMEAMEASNSEGVEAFVRIVRTARSAGITVAWSLQRSTFDQLPTIVRSQAAKMCFGMNSADDAHYGLSPAQIAANCEPELWTNRQPGMAYLDAPGVPAAKIAMPMRTFFFGENDDSLMRAHAAMYPASDRPCDEIMAAVDAPDADADTPGTAPDADTGTDAPAFVPRLVPGLDDDEDLDDEDLDDEDLEDDVADDSELDEEIEPLAEDVPLARTAVPKMDPARARATIRAWLADRPGQQVKNADLREVRLSTGLSRQWSYDVLAEFTAEGLVTRSDGQDGIVWTVTTRKSVLTGGVA
jgi:hypothetical protein